MANEDSGEQKENTRNRPAKWDSFYTVAVAFICIFIFGGCL